MRLHIITVVIATLACLLLACWPHASQAGITVQRNGSEEVRLKAESMATAPTLNQEDARSGRRPRRFSLLRQRHRPEPPPRQRDPQLSEDSWVLRGVDRHSNQRYQFVFPNPLLIRAESPAPDGSLSGQMIERDEAEFDLAIPADPAITELHLYQPTWDGEAFVLEWLGGVALKGGSR